MQKSMLRLHGFTLIEALMAIAILATLLAVAAPSYAGFLGRTQTKAARSALNTALAQARIAAVHRGASVVVCPSLDARTCQRSTQWQHGWIAFADLDHDRTRSDDEPLLSVAQAQPPGVAIVTSAGRRHIGYLPDGSAGGTNLSLTLCDRATGSSGAIQLVVSNTGRVRGGSPSAAQVAACLAAAG